MTRASTSLQFRERASLARRFCVLFAAALLLIANCAVQAHVHGVALRFAPLGQSVSAPVLPADQETACPLCQAMATSGSFLLPVAQVVVLAGESGPATQVWTLPLLHARPFMGWYSRGPPRH